MAESLDILRDPRVRRTRPFIIGAIAEGRSANATLQLLREHDMGFRRADFLKAFAALKEELADSFRLRFLPKHQRPSLENLPILNYLRTANFEFIIGINQLSSGPRPEFQRYVTIRTDLLTDRESIEQMAREALAEYDEQEGIDVFDVTLLRGGRAAILAG